MKTRYRLTRRGIRSDRFYCVDTTTGKRTSLRTANEEEARQIVEAKKQSERQPVLNLQIAKAYLAGADNGIATRTWRNAIDADIWRQLVRELTDQSQACVLGSGIERTASRGEERGVRKGKDHVAAGLAQRLG